jgi:hypothetical protein
LVRDQIPPPPSTCGLADFSFCVEESSEILSRLGAGAAMDAGADFFVP